MNVRDSIQQLVVDLKVAVMTATATVGTGLGTVLEWIPNDIGKLATLVGIILSVVLIYTHWRNGRIEYAKTQLEMDILRKREKERIENARIRREAGRPVRRDYDG